MATCEQPNGRLWKADDGLHLDVRGLTCPEPLVSVLRVIDGGEDAVIVHLDQEPLLLYPELDSRGCSHKVVASSESDGNLDQRGEVMLVIMRKGA